MLEHSEIQCFEEHELPVNPDKKGSRRTEVKFYPTGQCILICTPEITRVKLLKATIDLLAEGSEESDILLKNQSSPIVSVSVCEESNLICTISDEEVVLWKLDSNQRNWTSKVIAVDMGRVLCSAISVIDENIFTSLATGNEIVLVKCVQQPTCDINANGTFLLRDIQIVATADKNVEPNSWIHNFQFGTSLHIADLSSGNGVSLKIWEVCNDNKLIKLLYRSALQMKVLAAADFLRRDNENECYILAISPEGNCETFVGSVEKGFSILSRIKIEDSAITTKSAISDGVLVEFRILSARFLSLPSKYSSCSILGNIQSPDISLDLSNSLCPVNDMGYPKLLVCVATTASISVIDIRSCETSVTVKYEDMVKDRNAIISNGKLVALPTGEIIFAYQPLLQNCIFTFRMKFYETDEHESSAIEIESEQLSLISGKPTQLKSVLRKKLKSPRPKSTHQPRRTAPGFPVIRSKTAVLKRASYSKTDSFSLFKSLDKVKSDEQGFGHSLIHRNYYNNENLIFRDNCAAPLGTPLSSGLTDLRIASSPCGKLLAVGGNTSPLVIFKTQPKLQTDSVLKAVEKLTYLDFSFSSKFLAFATNDSSTSVINLKSGKKLLHVQFSSKFNEHVQSQFYYMDKFLIQPQDNHLVLYAYKIQEPTWSKLLAATFPLVCQQITAIGAANQLYSNLIACGLSNKSIQIFDANVEKVAATIPRSHSKSVNCIRINDSPQGTNATSLCNLFLTSTSSSFDPIKLWDLRTEKCVIRIADVNTKVHVPNARPALSPCGRYIATGFEDNTVVIYDVRKINSRVNSLKGLRAAVLECTFDRLTPKLWCGLSNGELLQFTT